MKGIDFKKWDTLIQSDPLWYINVLNDLGDLSELKEKENENYRKLKVQVYDFFESHIRANDIVLGDVLRNWDAERTPIDTILIHHTSHESGMTRDRLSAIELIRLYAPYFKKPYDTEDLIIKEKPIFSGHTRAGRQIFWPYHWIVRTDGSVERLLEDNEIGWQAGNWNVNCRSIAIVFDNDYENGVPSEKELDAVAKIIKENYSQVSKDRIFGHREINEKTTCPSNLFLDSNNQKGWKNDLLKRL